jgi:hypothetical protein
MLWRETFCHAGNRTCAVQPEARYTDWAIPANNNNNNNNNNTVADNRKKLYSDQVGSM